MKSGYGDYRVRHEGGESGRSEVEVSDSKYETLGERFKIVKALELLM